MSVPTFYSLSMYRLDCDVICTEKKLIDHRLIMQFSIKNEPNV